MTEKCDATRRPAGRPATAPIAALATGTLAIACATDLKPRGLEHRRAERLGLWLTNTATCTFMQTNKRDTMLDRQLFRIDAFAQTGRLMENHPSV